MGFQSKKVAGRSGREKVPFFRHGFVFLLLALGMILFPTESESIKCYDCFSRGEDNRCVSPPSYFQTINCKEGFCKKVYKKDGYFYRSCPDDDDYFNTSVLYECAEKFFGKEGEGGCLDITPENLKIVEDCHWSKVGNGNSKYPGFGYSLYPLGRSDWGGKTCFCKDDLCNDGPIPGIKETEELPSGVACYKCSTKPRPGDFFLKPECYFDLSYHKVWCPQQTHCFKMTGTQGLPLNFYPVEYTERGCSSNMFPNAAVEDTEKLIKCLKKYGGCVSIKSEAGSECFKGLVNDSAVSNHSTAFDLNELDELCICKGDFCNGNAPTSSPSDERVSESTGKNEKTSDHDKKIGDQSTLASFTLGLCFILVIIIIYIYIEVFGKD